MILTYFQDPGHGWLRIKRQEAQRILGESFSQITPHSYQKGDWIYLEEDQDAHLLIQAIKDQKLELIYTIREQHCNNESTIRHFDSFVA